MNRIVIIRTGKQDIQSKGYLYIYDDKDNMLLDAYSLELPWEENKQGISCIPEGVYNAQKHISPTFGDCIWIRDVPDRYEILLHPGNYVGSPNPNTGKPDLRGCIAPGSAFRDITGDGIQEVVKSRDTMHRILSHFSSDEQDPSAPAGPDGVPSGMFKVVIKHEDQLDA